MIEVKIIEKTYKPKSEYPCIKICSDLDIVLFTAPYKGTILKSISNAWKLGTYLEDWVEEQFKPFYGDITITSTD